MNSFDLETFMNMQQILHNQEKAVKTDYMAIRLARKKSKNEKKSKKVEKSKKSGKKFKKQKKSKKRRK